jgi:hypothetical protein
MELNAQKKQLERYEEHEHPHNSSVLPERHPELVTCKSCNKDLPTSRFKGNAMSFYHLTFQGTPSNTLVKILQKYAQQSAKRSANWSSPSRVRNIMKKY